jgi:hypothetical protein
MKWWLSYTLQPLYHQRNSLRYPVDWKLGGSQSWSRHGGGGKKPCPSHQEFHCSHPALNQSLLWLRCFSSLSNKLRNHTHIQYKYLNLQTEKYLSCSCVWFTKWRFIKCEVKRKNWYVRIWRVCKYMEENGCCFFKSIQALGWRM